VDINLIMSESPNRIEDGLTCYVCYTDFIIHQNSDGTFVPHRVDFRYKPHKRNWREQDVCTVCFYALQKPRHEWQDLDSYDGILIPYQKSNGWYYRDLREIDWEEPGWGNPESDDEDGRMNC
jgi:hypothetical protein